MKSLSLIGIAAVSLAIVSSASAGQIVVTSSDGMFTNTGSANASGPGRGYDNWFANNVRSGDSVGITGMYADQGNGSIQFAGTADSNAKADYEYYFSAPNTFLLSDLNAFSYDSYRASTSTASAKYSPALRLYVSDGSHTGYLVYEGIYNGQSAPALDAFQTNDVIGSKFWATGSLPNAFSNYDRTLADWTALLPNLRVYALSTGIGSGWDGTFDGAVDNITYGTGAGGSKTYNFEVNATPEPASFAFLGFGALAAIRRRRR